MWEIVIGVKQEARARTNKSKSETQVDDPRTALPKLCAQGHRTLE